MFAAILSLFGFSAAPKGLWKDRWINIKDRLPQEGQIVMIYTKGGCVFTWNNVRTANIDMSQCAYWRQLPPTPDEEAKVAVKKKAWLINQPAFSTFDGLVFGLLLMLCSGAVGALINDKVIKSNELTKHIEQTKQRHRSWEIIRSLHVGAHSNYQNAKHEFKANMNRMSSWQYTLVYDEFVKPAGNMLILTYDAQKTYEINEGRTGTKVLINHYNGLADDIKKELNEMDYRPSVSEIKHNANKNTNSNVNSNLVRVPVFSYVPTVDVKSDPYYQSLARVRIDAPEFIATMPNARWLEPLSVMPKPETYEPLPVMPREE